MDFSRENSVVAQGCEGFGYCFPKLSGFAVFSIIPGACNLVKKNVFKNHAPLFGNGRKPSFGQKAMKLVVII